VLRLNGSATMLLVSGPAPLKVQNLFGVSSWAGNGGAQTIVNGLPMSGGSDVFVKWRGGPTNTEGVLFDSGVGAGKPCFPNRYYYDGATYDGSLLTAFNGNGFSLGGGATVNAASQFYGAWSFIQAKGFFQSVAYSWNGAQPRVLPLTLGQPPGLVLVHRLTDVNADSDGQDGAIWHRSFAAMGRYHSNIQRVIDDPATPGLLFGNGSVQIDPTATALTLATNKQTNYPGESYVARIFAHQPGPAGIIACGSFTTDASGNAVVNTIGWQPQFVMSAPVGGGYFDLSDATNGLTSSTPLFNVGGVGSNQAITQVAGGFSVHSAYANTTMIYMAIRKGPL
jgi:hypothetical protein